MLPPKVTVTIPAIRERRYVRKEDGPAPAPAAPPPGPPGQRPPSGATSRQRIYVGKPGTEPPPPAAAPVPAPTPTIQPIPAIPLPPSVARAAAAAPALAPVAPPAPPLEPAPAPVAELPHSVPVFVGAEQEIAPSAYSPDEIRVLGIPRGLLPFSALEGLQLEPATSQDGESSAAEDALEEAAAAVAGPGPEPQPDPMLDEVIEGLKKRIAELRAARSGSVPGQNVIAPPAASPAASLWRATRPKKAPVFGLKGFLLLLLVAGGAAFGGLEVRKWMYPEETAPAPVPTVRPALPSPTPVAGVPTVPAKPLWTENDIRRLDAILSAERALSLEEMGRLLTQLQTERPGLPGLELVGARHAQLLRRFADAEVRLSRLAAEVGDSDPELTAELAFLRARNYASQRKLLEARNCLDEVLRRDPRRPEAHYEQAELNRRMGRVGEALVGFDRALARAGSGRVPSRAMIDFRRRLMLVESGREAEIGTETYLAELGKTNPAGEWALTAAAVSLHRGQFAAGAQWMLRARALMQPHAYLAAIEDYFFRAHAGRTELKDCFPTVAERSAFLLKSTPFLADP